MSDDWFKSVSAFDKFKSRTEDKACRKVLSMAKVSPGAVAKRLQLPGGHSVKLTFAHLRAALDFPGDPATTDDDPDDLLTLMAKFRKSRLYASWVHAWDERPDVYKKERVLVFLGPTWGLSVMHPKVPENRPHVRIGYGVPDGPLTIEPFAQWCLGFDWEPLRRSTDSE